MAIFHISVRNISKSEGRSVVQMSSYINGEEYRNELTGETFSKDRNDVISKGMFFRDDIPNDLRTPEKYWNALEKGTPSNARMAKHIDAALPVEHPEKWKKIVDEMIAEISKKYNLGAVQWAIHDKGDGNPHVHFLLPNYDYKDGKFTQERQQGYVCRNKETGEQQIFKSVKAIPEDYERIPAIDPKTGEQKLGKRNEKMWLRGDMVKNDLDKITFVDDLRQMWEKDHNKYVTIDHFISRLSNEARGIDKKPVRFRYKTYKSISKTKLDLKSLQAGLVQIKERIKQIEAFLQFKNLINNRQRKRGTKMNKKSVDLNTKSEILRAYNYGIIDNRDNIRELSDLQKALLYAKEELMKQKRRKNNKNERNENCLEK